MLNLNELDAQLFLYNIFACTSVFNLIYETKSVEMRDCTCICASTIPKQYVVVLLLLGMLNSSLKCFLCF